MKGESMNLHQTYRSEFPAVKNPVLNPHGSRTSSGSSRAMRVVVTVYPYTNWRAISSDSVAVRLVNGLIILVWE